MSRGFVSAFAVKAAAAPADCDEDGDEAAAAVDAMYTFKNIKLLEVLFFSFFSIIQHTLIHSHTSMVLDFGLV